MAPLWWAKYTTAFSTTKRTPQGGEIKFVFHRSKSTFPALSHANKNFAYLYTPPPYKRTGDIWVSPVHHHLFFVARPVFYREFSPIFPMFSLKKNKKLSPVHSRPSCPAPKLVARPVFRPSFYTGGGGVPVKNGVKLKMPCIQKINFSNSGFFTCKESDLSGATIISTPRFSFKVQSVSSSHWAAFIHRFWIFSAISFRSSPPSRSHSSR